MKHYQYGLHFYGPYSSALDAETMVLSADGIVIFDYSGSSHRMHINEKIEVASEGLSSDQEDEIDNLIMRFKDRSPSELELLTTAMYAYNHLEDKTEESVIRGVEKIKGTKYTREQIKQSFADFDFFDKKFMGK